MNGPFTQKEIRNIGIYLIVALALIRFLIYPLHASVDGKKKMLAEQIETYQIKTSLLGKHLSDKQKQAVGRKPATDQRAVLSKAYEKGSRFSRIQADTVESFVKLAEKKGLMVLDFELLEPATGRTISDVPVLIRISGQPGAFIDLLADIEQNDKALKVKTMEINKVGADFRFFVTLSAFRMEQ